jgi:KaiC/GvpD/RAD55 family RecA-like ATPase
MNQQKLNHLFLQLDSAKRDKEHYEKEIKALIADKELDVDARWNLFCAFCKLFKVESSHRTSLINLTKEAKTIFDNIWSGENRGEIIDVEEIAFRMKDYKVKIECINEFKEDVLQRFIYSFEYDW